MKRLVRCLAALMLIYGVNLSWGKTLQAYIKEAEDNQKTGSFAQAIAVMEEAVKAYPDSAIAYSYLGLYTGILAGQSSDMMEAGRLVNMSFEMLDKAVVLDSLNPRVRYYRGLMSINVPEFFGKLVGGIQDLEFLITIYEKSPNKVSKEIIVSGYDYLGKGYQKSGDNQKAKFAWEKVIALAPGTDLAVNAEENIKNLQPPETKPQPTEEKKPEGAAIAKLQEKLEKEPNNPGLLTELGKAYIDAENYREAENVLRQAIKIDSLNVDAYKLLALALGGIAGKGYDKRIYENTNTLTNIAFELTRILDKSVSIAPGDIELRLSRGIAGVSMPFFVGKLDQGIDDLNMVATSNTSDAVKAEALYWLGVAYQKKGMSYWTKVATQYSDVSVSKMAFEGMRPSIKHIDLSKYQTPILVIDFVLGFRDELPPQTAVWVEDKNGKFVKTIYVSGFSSYVKEKQVNLPLWAGSSKFTDVDAVTGASIDAGHHIYVWDLKDSSNKKVKSGEYILKVETCYWPSMKYQLATANIQLGNKDGKTVVEEGNFIPYLEVEYIRGAQ